MASIRHLRTRQSTITGTTTTYTRDPDGLVIDDHRPNGAADFYLYDGQGNVIGLLSTAGAIHRTYKYGPAGGVAQDTGTAFDTAIRYHGAWNGAGNMYHFGARDYDPILREWTQPDPLDQPTDLTQINSYGYVGNDPINETDPSGDCIILSCSTYHKVGHYISRNGRALGEIALGAVVATGGIAGGAACAAFTEGRELFDCYRLGSLGVATGGTFVVDGISKLRK